MAERKLQLAKFGMSEVKANIGRKKKGKDRIIFLNPEIPFGHPFGNVLQDLGFQNYITGKRSWIIVNDFFKGKEQKDLNKERKENDPAKKLLRKFSEIRKHSKQYQQGSPLFQNMNQ